MTMDINEKLNLLNYAERKAAGVKTSSDRYSAIAYAQALCHAKIITPDKFRMLTGVAEKSYLEHKSKK